MWGREDCCEEDLNLHGCYPTSPSMDPPGSAPVSLSLAMGMRSKHFGAGVVCVRLRLALSVFAE